MRPMFDDRLPPIYRTRKHQSVWSERWENFKASAPYLGAALLFFGGAMLLGTELGTSLERALDAALNGMQAGSEGGGIQAKWIKVYSDLDPRGWF